MPQEPRMAQRPGSWRGVAREAVDGRGRERSIATAVRADVKARIERIGVAKRMGEI